MITNEHDIVDKIRKLLRAASSEHEGERENALLMAKRLCAKHELDISEIDAWSDTKTVKESIERADLNLGNRMPIAQRFISHIIQDHFGCRIIYCGGRYEGRRLVLIGKKSDVEIASFINEFLNREFLDQWHKAKNQNGFRTEDRNSYFLGVFKGLNEKLKQSAAKFTDSYIADIRANKGEEAAVKVQESFALMRIGDKERIEEKVSQEFPRLSHKRSYYSSGRHSENAMDKGYVAGKNINLHRPVTAGYNNEINS